jgi:hypothetical protein
VMDYENRAYFNYPKDYKKLGYKTHKSSLLGLRELITNNIIACDVRPHHYWLNPTIVCKGERFAMYTEFVIGKDGKQIKAENQLKQQNKTLREALPEGVQDKLKKASASKPFNEDNSLPFDKVNPYRQTSILDEDQQME